MMDPERLDSWKAIATYLGRDVSTVRRWERLEGLPVHRHIHQKQGSVYAFPSELDVWWNNRAQASGLKSEGHDSRSRTLRVRRLAVPSLIVATALLVAVSWHGRAGERNVALHAAVDFIAVMPFASAAGNTADDLFVDNLTEGIINGLSAVPGLKVISRTSTFRYKQAEIVPQNVGRELGGVDALLVGRIRRESGRLLLAVELIDVRDGSQLWGTTYERALMPSSESLHQAVVRDVARALTGRTPAPSYNTYARNAQAYELYLRGRHHWYKRTPEGFARAIAAFSQAIEQDATFAPAYAGLADTYTLMGYFAYLIPFDEARSKARAAAVKALELDDSLAEAHTSMASVLEFEEWDWAGAEREYQRAISLAPNYATAYHWYGNNLSLRGRHAEAIAYGRRAVELDPLSPILHVALAHAYLLAGQDDAAARQLTTALEIEPSSANAHLFRGFAYVRQSRYDEALVEMLTADRLFENWVWRASLVDLYMRMDRPADARRIVAAFEGRRPNTSLVTTAAIYAAAGERERPLALLRRACDARDPDIAFIKSVTAFDRLRADPEFNALLRRSGLS